MGVDSSSVFYVCVIAYLAIRESVGRKIQNVNRGGQAMGHAHVANRDSRLPRGSPARPSPRQDHRERSAV